jgi:arylsulfatase A-like enzyme
MYAKGSPEIDYNRGGFFNEFNDSDMQLSAENLRHMLDTYDEGIRYVDAKIGEVLSELKASGLYDSTMIVLLADHGDEFTEHGKLGHGHTLYDELVRVPLIVKYPCENSNCSAERINTVVEVIDVMPTILGTVGAQMPAGTMAVPLPANDANAEGSFAISEVADSISYRTAQKKIVISTDSEKLFDLTNDSLEMAGSDAGAELTDLREKLFSNVDKMDEGFSVERQSVELDDETRKKLEALGYVE